MLCFRCGSQVGAGSALCQSCGQSFSPARTATATPPRPQRALGAPLPFKLGDLVAGRYETRRLIGEGPLGVVYVAHDRETEVDLALKVIRPAVLPRPGDRDAFFESMRRLRGVGHFNLNHVIEVDRDADRCFFTAPLLEGLSLRKLMALRRSRRERFALSEVIPIAAQVADALAAGIRIGAHGDLKPDNVIILPEMLKVTDFGLALALPRAEFLQAQEASAEATAYVAPEVRGGAIADSRSDIFAFGTMIVELLSGRLPTGARIRLRDHQPDLPARLEDLAQRMLNEDPSGRPDSPEEAVQELAAVESGTERGAQPSVRRSFAPEQTQRISADMLEEVLDAADGMDEDAFAGELEAEAAAIDRAAAAALAEAAEGTVTDPGMPPVRMDPATFTTDQAVMSSPDVTQKISSEMVVEMLEGESLDEPSESERADADSLRGSPGPPASEARLGWIERGVRGGQRPTRSSDEPVLPPPARGAPGARGPRTADDLDPRLVRAALGVELEESTSHSSFEELSDAKTRALPELRSDDGDGMDSTDEMPRLRPEDLGSVGAPSAGVPSAGAPSERSSSGVEQLRRQAPGSSAVEATEALTTLERPLPERTASAQRALVPAVPASDERSESERAEGPRPTRSNDEDATRRAPRPQSRPGVASVEPSQRVPARSAQGRDPSGAGREAKADRGATVERKPAAAAAPQPVARSAGAPSAPARTPERAPKAPVAPAVSTPPPPRQARPRAPTPPPPPPTQAAPRSAPAASPPAPAPPAPRPAAPASQPSAAQAASGPAPASIAPQRALLAADPAVPQRAQPQVAIAPAGPAAAPQVRSAARAPAGPAPAAVSPMSAPAPMAVGQPAPTAAPSAAPATPPSSIEGSGGFSDQWYAAEAELQEGGADDSGKRREPTRVIRTDASFGRDLSGVWVWVALAVGLLAFLVGGGFYWQRLQRDARDRAARELVRQLQEAEQNAQMPQAPPPPSPTPQQAPSPSVAPQGPPLPQSLGPAPQSGLPAAPSPPAPP